MKFEFVTLERAVAALLILFMVVGLAVFHAVVLAGDPAQPEAEAVETDGGSADGAQVPPGGSLDEGSPMSTTPRSRSNSGDSSDSGRRKDTVELPGVAPEHRWFEEVSEETGFEFESGGSGFGSPLEGPPTGVYVSDYDRDGWTDVLALNTAGTVLFENRGGEFHRQLNLTGGSHSYTSALFFDHDNDGYDDLYLMGDERSVFLENQNGEFRPRDVGLPGSFHSVRGASAADYDGDGCLDLFVVQANDWEDSRPEGYDDRNVSIEQDNGGANLLYDGDCGGFENVTGQAGIRGTAWSLASSFVDLTGDGLPDIHVANDFNKDVVYVNKGDGSFERHVLPEFTNRNGMSSEVADVNEDGKPEVFVTNIHGDAMVANHRYGGRIQGNYVLTYDEGPEEFQDVGPEHGLVEGGFGWAASIEDFDNDGYPDVVHSVTDRTGHEHPPIWRNQPGSNEYQRLNSSAAGLDASGFVGNAVLDYDRDGRPDIVFADTRDRYSLYQNQNDGSYLRVEVEPRRNQTAIGAEVTVHLGDNERTELLSVESDYMSQSWRTLHFGLGSYTEVDRVEVEWPDGTRKVLEDVEAGKTVQVYPGNER